jgi:hypothetical protein
MANLGLIGALGGLGAGITDVAKMTLDEAKDARLEELRTKNNRETNKVNNDQRFDQAKQTAAIEHDFNMGELAQGQEYSLAELAQRDAAAKEQLRLGADLDNSKLTSEQKNSQYWAKEGGVPVADQYKDSQYNTTVRPPNKVAEGEYLRSIGASEETIQSHVTGEMSPTQLKQKLTVELAGSDYINPSEIGAKVDQIVAGLSGGAPAGGAPPSTNSRGWKLHVDGNGNRAYVGPNGEIEEL